MLDILLVHTLYVCARVLTEDNTDRKFSKLRIRISIHTTHYDGHSHSTHADSQSEKKTLKNVCVRCMLDLFSQSSPVCPSFFTRLYITDWLGTCLRSLTWKLDSCKPIDVIEHFFFSLFLAWLLHNFLFFFLLLLLLFPLQSSCLCPAFQHWVQFDAVVTVLLLWHADLVVVNMIWCNMPMQPVNWNFIFIVVITCVWISRRRSCWMEEHNVSPSHNSMLCVCVVCVWV